MTNTLPPFQAVWKDESGARIFRGADWSLGSSIEKDLFEGVLAPGVCSEEFSVALINPAGERLLEARGRDGSYPDGAPEKMVNVRLYLDSETESTVQALVQEWPQVGAGVELSFDHGVSWRRISASWGNPLDESTWIPLPATALAPGGVAGELLPSPPHHRASLLLRVKTPSAPSWGLLRFELAVDCDVL